MMISVAALQAPLGQGLSLEDKLHLIRHRPDYVCLPEYFYIRPIDQSYDDSTPLIESRLAELKHLSKDLGCTIIGGTMPHPVKGGYGNIATVFNRGSVVGSYQKVNPFGREEQRGIVPGSEYRVFDIDGIRIGILICADVLNPQSFTELARLNTDVIFVPTVSPYRTSDTVFEKDQRDTSIFVAGAQRACAYIVKTCGIGTLFGGALQGRSGIFAPWGILRRVPPDSEDKKLVLSAVLDIDEIRDFKRMMAPDELRASEAASREK